ncbi:hypothetical protein BU16DRAFT_531421 [Lophium mytilinum]|uniref:DUF7730 domain-containing protein n=1 Tax=Lophium mytilinum TaxID=390894 RepID=A0A6A6QEN6_9PEZI|nr:hypothetical protein BU16DRAFT_531421 [Lophium mytilinum]
MSNVQAATRSQPKRKRAQVKYYEGNDDDLLASDQEVEEFSTSKRSKAKPRPLPKRKIFPFLSLPAELRNIIYEHALVDGNGVHLIAKTEHYRRVVIRENPVTNVVNGPFGRVRYRNGFPHPYGGSNEEEDEEESSKPISFVPSLLAVNRQICAEALPILYSNKFMLEDTTALHSFMADLRPKTRELLEDVTIQGWGYTKAHKALNHPGLTMLSGAVNLKRLHFQCRIGWGNNVRKVARQVYRDGFHWLEAVGVAKGNYDAAVDLISLAEFTHHRSPWRIPNEEDAVDQAAKMEAFGDELRKLLSYKKPSSSRKSEGKRNGKGKGKVDD